MPPRLAVRDISLFERPVSFARPFRFGAVTITSAVQAFVRAEIEVEGRGMSVGASAELMAPKWFDKRPQLSPEETVDRIAAFAGHCARALSEPAGFRDRLRPACLAPRRASLGVCEGRHPAARRRLRAGRDRQGGAGCAAARRGHEFLRRHGGERRRRRCAPVARSCERRTSRNSWRDAGGWSGSPFAIPSVSTTGSRARAVSPISTKMPARIISSSSSTAIRSMMPPA